MFIGTFLHLFSAAKNQVHLLLIFQSYHWLSLYLQNARVLTPVHNYMQRYILRSC